MPDIVDNVMGLFKFHSDKIWKAFKRAFDRIRNEAILSDLADAIRRKDYITAIQAVRIEPQVFDEFLNEIRQSVFSAGNHVADVISRMRDAAGKKLVFRFGVRNARAENFMRAQSGEKIVGDLIEEQRRLVRDTLTSGLERGDNPNRVALDVVGRINKETGKREGGVLGLSDQFAKYVANARDELERGDYKAYLTRDRRDKRFDRTIQKAIREGRSLTKDQIAKITGQYSERLLALRGETIARTEAMSSLAFGKAEAIRQLIESGKVRADQVKKTWQATNDRRTRDTHLRLHGETLPYSLPFTSLSGARLMYPMDRSLGASGAEIINCRCNIKYRIDWIGNYLAEDAT